MSFPNDSLSTAINPHTPGYGQFLVRFWGVRGSIPTPGVESLRYGGNTSCVEVRVGGACIILDGGTGLRVLGQTLVQESPLKAYLFFTHSHWDRIQGFPFFKPAFMPGNCFHIYGAAATNGASIKQRLMDQMTRPNFPVPLHLMEANLEFRSIVPGEIIEIATDNESAPIEIQTCSLNRFDRSLGYRITWQNHAIVYATDVDFRTHSADPALLDLVREADLLIYDTAQEEQDYAGHVPATTNEDPAWHKGLELAKSASVNRLVLFHHDPDHHDIWLGSMEEKVQGLFKNCAFAKEGMTIVI